MIIADLARAAAILIVPVAFFANALSFPLLLVVAFLIGSISSSSIRLDDAVLDRRSAGQYVEANALLNTSRSVSRSAARPSPAC